MFCTEDPIAVDSLRAVKAGAACLFDADELLTRDFRLSSIWLNPLILLVPTERFELPTFGLQNRCTTTVLSRQREIAKGGCGTQAESYFRIWKQ
jgi:hypothetical protein